MSEVSTKTKSPAKNIDKRLIPSANIGMIGHVAHGKTTLTEALTNRLTLTHSEELKRGITIRLGYADMRIYKCPKCKKYCSTEKCSGCFEDAELQRTVSFIDAPGHETLMATVLSGASLMDGAILVIAANEKCPQPQTREHLMALDAVGIKNAIIVQSKIDLVNEKEALENYKQIKDFVKGTTLEGAPVIPVSSQKGVNIDVLLDHIEKIIPSVDYGEAMSKEPKMLIARSFDINKPGYSPKKIVGGTIGGSIVSGVLKIGDEIEIRPGYRNGSKYSPLKTKIVGLQKAFMNLEEAGPGGLLGVMTELDPSLTKSDLLVGNVVGLPGKLPESKDEIEFDVHLMKRVVGSEEMGDVRPLKVGESLMVNVGTARSVGSIESVKKVVKLKLKLPLCVEKKERIAISRQVSGRWRLIGYGIIA